MAAEEYGALNAELAEPEELAAEVVLAYDGLSPTAKVEETEAGAKITVVDKHGTTTATVKNGKDGATGAPGAHIGPEAPTNGEKLWVDTDEAPEESETEGGTQIDVVAKAGQLLSVAEVDADGKPTKWQAVDLPKAETPNFAANEGEKGYIEGRTHYVDAKGIVHKLDNKFIDADWMATSKEVPSTVEIIPEQKISSGMWKNIDSNMLPGFVYDVHINGVVYPCEARSYYNGAVLGNNTDFTLNNYPFCIMWAGGSATSGMFFINDTLSYPLLLKVTDHAYTEYNKLPVDFLPNEAAQKTDVAKAIEEQDTETKKYIAEYVKPIIASVGANSAAIEKKITAPTAAVGQIIRVKTVNAEGTPTEWEAVDLPTGGGGNANIDVTASVGQTIIVEEVDASGKPTKWKPADYQPRTHWTDETVILPETTTEPDEDGAFVIPALLFVAGAEYIVNYNGVQYAVKGAYLGEDDGGVVTGLGNTAVEMETGDTGEPFVILSLFFEENHEYNFAELIPLDGSETVTLSIAEVKHTPIPAPYLTNAFPYYIDIVGSGATDNPYVCNDTVANVRAAYDGGRQLFVRKAMAGDGIWAKIHIPLVSVAEGSGVRVYSFFAQGASAASLYRFELTEQEDGTFAMAT